MKRWLTYLKDGFFTIFWFTLAVAYIFIGEPAATIGCLIMGELHRLGNTLRNYIVLRLKEKSE